MKEREIILSENHIYMLLKFGKKKHLEMLQQGKMFFGTRKFYNEIAEKGNENIGDMYEGVFPNKNCDIQLIDNESKKLLARIAGTLIQSDESVDRIPFFSCTYISDENIDENKKIIYDDAFKECFMGEEGWEYVLAINGQILLERIRMTLEGINVVAKQMKYSDYEYLAIERNEEIENNIKNVLLWKDIKYSFQKEFRIILENKEFGEFTNGIIEIGDISDISYLVEKDTWFKMSFKIEIH